MHIFFLNYFNKLNILSIVLLSCNLGINPALFGTNRSSCIHCALEAHFALISSRCSFAYRSLTKRSSNSVQGSNSVLTEIKSSFIAAHSSIGQVECFRDWTCTCTRNGHRCLVWSFVQRSPINCCSLKVLSFLLYCSQLNLEGRIF